jgi:DNA-binding MurR/RpiR family transcriptional regulator
VSARGSNPVATTTGRRFTKLKKLGVDVKHENHQMIVSSRKVKVDDTGIVLS